jgi:hypothetical protein
MNWKIEIGAKASAQLETLDTAVGASVERKIVWLTENANVMVHRRLVEMPEILLGYANYGLVIGDYRILYWP